MSDDKEVIDDLLRVTEELIGIHAINPFACYMSSSRSVMLSSHLSQALVIENSEEPIVQSGVERELGKYTMYAGPNCNCRIIKIIPRYRPGFDSDSIEFSPEKIVIYEDTDTMEIGYFTVPYFRSMHQHFGFKYQLTDLGKSLVPETYLGKEDVVADTPNKKENGGYGYGINLNTALMSAPGVAEDGYIVSESALQKLKFRIYEKRTVEFGRESFPLNLYGDESHYKIMPEIGEKIHPSGILMALRKHDDLITPVSLGVRSTMDVDVTFDECIYVREGEGRVVDIVVTHNPTTNTRTLSNTTDCLNKYINGIRTFYEELLSMEAEIYRKRKMKYGDTNVVFKHSLTRLLAEAHSYIDTDRASGGSKYRNNITKTFKNDVLDEYRIDFVIEYIITPTVGFKLTGIHGDKGVITDVWPDERMPVDKNGVRAELIGDPTSTIKRMNISRLYLHYFSDACVHVTKLVRDKLKTHMLNKEDAKLFVQTCTDDKILEAYDLILGFLEIVSPVQYRYYSEHRNNQEAVREVILQCVTDTFRMLAKISDVDEYGKPLKYDEIVGRLERTVYKPHLDTIFVTNSMGEKEETSEKIRIAPLYFMLLEKIGDSWLSISSAKTNHFGVLTSMVKADKHRVPWRASPVRTISETEGRLYCGYMGTEATAEIMDQSTNMDTHRMIYERLLVDDKPMCIDKIIDRDQYPFGEGKPLQILKHLFMCSGIQLAYKPDKKAKFK